MDKIILALIPTLSILGTFLIMYADNHKIKIDPQYGIDKMASQILPNVSRDRIIRHEKLYLPQNKKMQALKIIGIVFIIVSGLLTFYQIFTA